MGDSFLKVKIKWVVKVVPKKIFMKRFGVVQMRKMLGEFGVSSMSYDKETLYKLLSKSVKDSR